MSHVDQFYFVRVCSMFWTAHLCCVHTNLIFLGTNHIRCSANIYNFDFHSIYIVFFALSLLHSEDAIPGFLFHRWKFQPWLSDVTSEATQSLTSFDKLVVMFTDWVIYVAVEQQFTLFGLPSQSFSHVLFTGAQCVSVH
jgi:hypothetical protein